MMYQRLISPYLPDHDFSDYLIEQYQDILDICNATNNMPELIIRDPPNYANATPPVLNFTGVANGSVCYGQTILKSTLDSNANCNSISQAFNAATGDVQYATGSDTCVSNEESFCLPAPCELATVPSNATCDSLAASFSNVTANFTVSTNLLLMWNPNINGLCDNLQEADYVCAGPSGGSYFPPPPLPGSSTDNGQQRGGGDGSNLNSTALLCTRQTPSPTQAGIEQDCTRWCQAPGGDYCFNFAAETNITTDQLYTWNPVLGQGGSNCNTGFQLGYYYCIEKPGSTPVSSTAASSPTSASPVPSPTQPGITSNCDDYMIAKSGDYCYAFAQENNISTDNLYAWNTILGAGGANCQTQFQAGYYYCVGVSS